MTTTPLASPPRHALRFKTAAPLIRALHNGLIFAGADFSQLGVVKFEFDGTHLEVLTTDRTRVCIERLDQGQDNPTERAAFAFLLPRSSAKAALAFFKGVFKSDKHHPIDVVYEAGTVRFHTPCGDAEYSTDDAAFPSVRHIFPSSDNKSPVTEIGFNARALADYGKVQTGDKVAFLALTFFGGGVDSSRPVLAEYINGPRVLYLSARLG